MFANNNSNNVELLNEAGSVEERREETLSHKTLDIYAVMDPVAGRAPMVQLSTKAVAIQGWEAEVPQNNIGIAS